MHSYSRNIKEYIYGAGNEQDRFTYLPKSLIPILTKYLITAIYRLMIVLQLWYKIVSVFVLNIL